MIRLSNNLSCLVLVVMLSIASLTSFQLSATEKKLEFEPGTGLTLQDRDAVTALPYNKYPIEKDWHRISFAAHLNADPFKLIDLASLEAIYYRKINGLWYHGMAGITNSTFEQISENPTSSSGNTNAEASNLRSSGTKVSLINLGLGISYRFRFLYYLLPDKPLVEECSTTITYNRFSDTLRTLTYTGPGIKIDYGVQYRSNSSFHYGLKMSYNIASGKRAAEYEMEPSTDRTLTLSWLSIGVDFTFYLQ